MKLKREIKETDNSTVYRRLRNIYLAERLGKCGHCSMNRGCNRNRWPARNWKRFRKTQYKEIQYE